MSTINIKQFDGSNYTTLLPYSESSNWGYEGYVPDLIRVSYSSDEEFLSKLEAEYAKMPNKSAKQIAWQDHPALTGWTFIGTLWRDNADYGHLTGHSYGDLSYVRYKYNGQWSQFYKMATLDLYYAKSQVGRYIGTGTYGQDSPNTLSFNFPVKYFMIRQSNSGSNNNSFKGFSYVFNWAFPDFLSTDYTYQNDSYNFLVTNNSYAYIYLKTDSQKESISWYNIQNKNNTGADYQLNAAGTVYFYIALG